MGSEKDGIVATSGVRFDHPCASREKVIDGRNGIVERDPNKKKVAIVGFASSTRMGAPFDDPSYAIWGMNQLYRHIPRADRWFEIHSNWDEHVVDGTDHEGWIKAAPIPVYMAEYHAKFPTCVKFPLDALKTEFGDYFTSSVAFMLALAIKEQFEEIAIFGIDMIVGTEYFEQKACVEYWIGVANGRGIQVKIPPQSALCKQHYRYGYELEPNTGFIRPSDLEKRVADLRKKRNELGAQLALIDGALQDAEYWQEVLTLRMRGGLVPM